jgi:hypothetical protein
MVKITSFGEAVIGVISLKIINKKSGSTDESLIRRIGTLYESEREQGGLWSKMEVKRPTGPPTA